MSVFSTNRVRRALIGFGAALATGLGAMSVHAGDIDYGKPGEPVKLVIGYQPFYTESWSGVVMRGKKFYEKYLPKGSTVEFSVGLQGAVIVNAMLAGKQHIGYVGDMGITWNVVVAAEMISGGGSSGGGAGGGMSARSIAFGT